MHLQHRTNPAANGRESASRQRRRLFEGVSSKNQHRRASQKCVYAGFAIEFKPGLLRQPGPSWGIVIFRAEKDTSHSPTATADEILVQVRIVQTNQHKEAHQ
jgi:hypothetical protein